ncbi:MAG: MSCRAMM family adhesin SdrC [Candidatus Thiodiazotropha sp. (ex Ustalcina ferruginea)]|nr:MSCRAMM family adhesin SdrC [Candidatus Thiodiazotropha sp. (ex Ustalcina ferruginea)]
MGVEDGTLNAYYGEGQLSALMLMVNGVEYAAHNEGFGPDYGNSAALVETGIGQLNTTAGAIDDLVIHRRVYVQGALSDGGEEGPDVTGDFTGFVRYLDVVDNPTDQAKLLTLTVTTELPFGLNGAQQTSSGDALLTDEDHYILLPDSGATVGYLFAGQQAAVQPWARMVGGDVSASYVFLVPPHSRRSVMSFVTYDNDNSQVESTLVDLMNMRPGALDGLSDVEKSSIINFFPDEDRDHDRLSDSDEALYATDPDNRDSDDDQLDDGFEVRYGFDPLSPVNSGETDQDGDLDNLTNLQEQSLGTDPTLSDSDGDGISDGDEYLIHDTEPTLPDSDNDGLSDGEELGLGTDPWLVDSDSDGLSDVEEIQQYDTDPLLADSDGDSLSDGFEIIYNLNDPLVDEDGDGLNNAQESSAETNPFNRDSDADLLWDSQEVNEYQTDPNRADTDRGGRSDASELIVDNRDATVATDDLASIWGSQTLYEESGRFWRINNYWGRVDSTTDVATRNGFRLRVNGREFTNPSYRMGQSSDGRELYFNVAGQANLIFSRRVRIPESGQGLIRYLEVVHNPTPMPQEVWLEIESDYYGLDENTAVLTSSSDGELTPEDDFLVLSDTLSTSNRPALGHLFAGANGSVRPDSTTLDGGRWIVSYRFMVPPGENRMILHAGGDAEQ